MRVGVGGLGLCRREAAAERELGDGVKDSGYSWSAGQDGVGSVCVGLIKT